MDLKRGLDLELDLFALLAPTKDAREAPRRSVNGANRDLPASKAPLKTIRNRA